MPFNYPVTEIYSAEGKRCVFSAEEYDVKIADGWSDTPPAPQEFNTPANEQDGCMGDWGPGEYEAWQKLSPKERAAQAKSNLKQLFQDAPLVLTAPEFELVKAEEHLSDQPTWIIPALPKHRRGKK